MRLNKIKLAGFKSFVDPTTIHLPSNLVGVVGPNGCGKSNVIDAVRWVMGESSAKTLRGDSMADVIFNGSSSRKPVGQAAIELIFDNSQGTLGGHYGQYSEISIKRSVSRDGQSSYFLNGTRCRRRDITDIFLGTGLGPRSYSIIEQGMISRLIEAKPEDLRVFLEEAAGISKYKERRRETETRMRHTRENLDRLNDLREELEKQLNHLQRQARTAERFEVLKQEQRLLKAQLQALRWNTLEQEVVSKEALIKDEEIVGEERTSKLRNIEAQTEKYHEQQVEANDAFNEVQGRFYSVGADIARVEQAIQHAKERLQQLQQDLEQTDSAWNEVQIHIEADTRRIEQLQGELQANEPQLIQAREAEQASSAVYAEAEQQMQDWQARWDDFNQQAAVPSETAQVERTRISHLEQHMLQTKQRMERLHSELGHVSSADLEQEIGTFTAQQAEVEQAVSRLQESQQTRQQAIQRQREHNHELSTQLDHTRSQLQTLCGKQASLEALQQAALGKRQGAVSEWLEHQGLRDAKRLAQTLQVDAEWERAVECVLGFNLEAVCVDAIDPVAAMLENLQHGALTLFDAQAGSGAAPATSGVPLTSKVNSPLQLTALLGGVVTADSLQEALAIRPRLADHESVITRDGIWMGNSWLRVTRDADEKAGVLHREQELKEIAGEIARLQQRADELQQQLEQGRQTLRSEEEQRDALQAELNQSNRRFSELRGQLSGRQARLEQLRLRGERIQEELNELTQQHAQDEAAYMASRQQLTEALEQMEVLGQQREALAAEREQLREALNQRREQAQHDRNQVHHITLTLQSQRTTLEATQQSLSRMQNQLTQLSGRREELHTALAEGDQPIMALDQELKTLLSSRMAVEKELGDARRQVEEIDHAMRQLSAERHSVEQAIQEVRSRLERLRMDWQGIQVRRQTVVEQIAEAGFEPGQLLQELPEQATEAAWQESLENVTRRIERLGPINLAAIDEFKKQSERKEYLDAQNADLTEALETLESAIRKIDRETRTRFKETYDKVNSSFQTYFPRLFGGGHAYLELTGDDLLSTGVTVMARPPGKRNSTIHLLSGGEKALTAVAMVFSIFELNPAPFCMLDEVDAPLDEANVGRFCELVREMSQRVQFIFITHNKATMELAEQLNGVTMYEPGVSRLVAVDMDEAYQMAVAS